MANGLKTIKRKNDELDVFIKSLDVYVSRLQVKRKYKFTHRCCREIYS